MLQDRLEPTFTTPPAFPLATILKWPCCRQNSQGAMSTAGCWQRGYFFGWQDGLCATTFTSGRLDRVNGLLLGAFWTFQRITNGLLMRSGENSMVRAPL